MERFNEVCLQNASQHERTYTAVDQGTGYPASFEDMTASKTLRVRIGAQVMLNRHVDSELTYGTLGVVAGFSNRWPRRLGGSASDSESTLWPLVRFFDSADIGRMVLVKPFMFTVKLGNGNELSRTQVGWFKNRVCNLILNYSRYRCFSVGRVPWAALKEWPSTGWRSIWPNNQTVRVSGSFKLNLRCFY